MLSNCTFKWIIKFIPCTECHFFFFFPLYTTWTWVYKRQFLSVAVFLGDHHHPSGKRWWWYVPKRTSEFPLTLGLAQHRFDECKKLFRILSLTHPCLQIVLGLQKDFFMLCCWTLCHYGLSLCHYTFLNSNCIHLLMQRKRNYKCKVS